MGVNDTWQQKRGIELPSIIAALVTALPTYGTHIAQLQNIKIKLLLIELTTMYSPMNSSFFKLLRFPSVDDVCYNPTVWLGFGCSRMAVMDQGPSHMSYAIGVKIITLIFVWFQHVDPTRYKLSLAEHPLAGFAASCYASPAQ